MAVRFARKKRLKYVPGTTVKCESGRYIAFYEHRTDIIANGDNEIDAKRNLKEMYKIVVKHEEEEEQKKTEDLPTNFQKKSFTEKIPMS